MMNKVFERRLNQDGRGGFNVTLRCLGIIVIIFIASATSTSPFNQATAVASSSQSKQTSIIKNVFIVNRGNIYLRVLGPTSLSTNEVKVEASLGDLLNHHQYKDFKKIKIVGKARLINSQSQSKGSQPQGSNLGQIVWNQVSINNKGKLQTQSLHKPLTSSFKLRSPYLKAGSTLKAQGDIQALIEDAQKLLDSEGNKSTKGNDNDQTEEIEQPQGVLNTERRVDDASSHEKAVRGNPRGRIISDELPSQVDSSLTENSSAGSKGSIPSKSGSPKAPPGSKGTEQSHQGGDKASQVATFNASSQGQRQLNRHSPASHNNAGGRGSTGLGEPTSSFTSPSSQNSQFHPGPVSSQGALFAGSPSSNPAFPGSNGSPRSGIMGGDNIDAQGSSGLGSQSSSRTDPTCEPIPLPRIEVRLTQEGCTPRVDFAQGRVVIQSRSQTFQDGTMTQESPCSDTFDTYPIKKDYRCEDCTDLVDHENRVAYARYRNYWVDAHSRRHEISAHLETDEARPYPFIEEPGLCVPELDICNNLAYRQAETVYFNRTNGRIKVAECHRLQGAQPISMSLTSQGCTPVHDFAAKTSKECKRLMFQMDSSEHEALPCHEVGSSIAHEFVTSVCTPIHDLSQNLVTPMARRRIQTSQGLKFITEECEPYGRSVLLQSTVQGCEGEYYHDFEGGKSYLKKRWYHTLNRALTYITGCMRSEQFLHHQVAIKGYQHDDAAKVSRPKTSISLIPSQGQSLEISRPQVRTNAPRIPYTLIRQSQRSSLLREATFEGCHRMTPTDILRIYRRGDGSTCEIVIGEGTPIRGPDECQRTSETIEKDEYQAHLYGHDDGGHIQPRGSAIFDDLASAKSYVWGSSVPWIRVRKVRKARTKITDPLGQITYTEWEQTGLIHDWVTAFGYCHEDVRHLYQ
jgi:hypothetical protein